MPGQARVDHRQIDVLAIKPDLAKRAAVAIKLLRFDLHVFAEDEIGQVLFGALPEGHLLFWGINARQANLVLPLVGIQ